jgi:hypothetical protein
MMSTDEKKPESGFTLVDQDAESDSAEKPASEDGRGAIPAIDFSTFVLSLGTSALYQMGRPGDPKTGEEPVQPNLLIAHQTIDTLEMISKKTQGNLDSEETKLLESILYELRMRFVEVREKDGEGNG